MVSYWQHIRGRVVTADSRTVIRWAGWAVYGWLFVMFVFLVLNMEMLWGRGSMQWMRYAEATRLNNLFMHLFYVKSHAPWVLAVHGISLVLAAFGWGGAVPRMLVFVTAGMLYFSAFSVLNGGYALIWQLSGFLVLFNRSGLWMWFGDWSRPLLWALRMQVVTVYFFSALNKLQGTTWLDGSAVYYALRNDAFAGSGLDALVQSWPTLAAALTWGGLVYQCAFPLLIWFSRMRPYLLMAGVVFHLFIALFMGLPDFGLAMVLSYVVFGGRDFKQA